MGSLPTGGRRIRCVGKPVTVPRHLLAALTCAAVLATGADAASGATLHGTVAGHPVLHGRSVVVPVATRARVVRVTARRIVGPNGGLRPLALRPADRVAVRVRGRGGRRVRAAVLRVTRRSGAPSYGRLDAERSSARAGVKDAAAAVAALPERTQAARSTGEAAAAVRARLLTLRTQVNTLIAGLRSTADALDASRARVPAAADLTAFATACRTAATALDDAVARLDAVLNDVGGTSAPGVPLGTTSTLSDVLHAILVALGEPEVAGPAG